MINFVRVILNYWFKPFELDNSFCPLPPQESNKPKQAIARIICNLSFAIIQISFIVIQTSSFLMLGVSL